MSIENKIDRNEQLLDKRGRGLHRIITPDAKQIELTEKWILPYKDLILRDMAIIRKSVDRKFKKDKDMRGQSKMWDVHYPIGRCQEIRDEAYKMIKSEMFNSRYMGLKMIKNFVRQGGILKEFWGIDNNKYFQNAIQIGDSILDVANDTVNPGKPPVVFYPSLHESKVEQITSVEQFAEICEKYWGYDVYPNIYLPYFAPVYPIIALKPGYKARDKKKHLVIPEGVSTLINENIFTIKDQTLFAYSKSFLFESKWSGKRLPLDVLEDLFSKNNRLRILEKKYPHIFKISTDPEDARNEIANFGMEKPGNIPYNLIEHVYEILKAGGGLSEFTLARSKSEDHRPKPKHD